jgi:DNA polymerase I-like protein with 3'-5' exonuclease and polymerase domains
MILELREHVGLEKFLRSWTEKIDGDGFMHPNFLLHGTVTGRLSCKNPNLQQVPRDKRLRPLFTAPDGWTFVEADYSQVELRIAAMMSGDPTLLEIYRQAGDVHTATAMLITGLPKEQITEDMRKKAKAVNFGFLYGMGAKKFVIYALDNYGVTVSLQEATLFRERFFEKFYGLPPWHDRQKKLAKRDKRVRSRMGRLRRLPEIDSGDKFSRSEAERQAVNSPVQSLASDMCLFSFVRLGAEQDWDFIRPVGLVHDAIVLMVRTDRLDEGCRIIKDTMEDVATMERVFGAHLTVPIEAEVKYGPWGKGVKWKR